MLATNKLHIFYAILVALIAQAQCNDLLCYVCDNCTNITNHTPKEKCDESFFKTDTTRPPMISTDATTTTTTTTTPETTTTTPETTTNAATQPPTTTTKNATRPTPPSDGQPAITTLLPTPTNPVTAAGPIQIEIETLNETKTQAAVTETPTFNSNTDTLQTTFLSPVNISIQPADVVMRQKRAVNETAFTYHCYSVRQSVNQTTVTSRGCSRVSLKEDVCTKLGQANNTALNSTCTACSNSLCNSSSSLAAPLVTMFLGLVVALVLGTTA